MRQLYVLKTIYLFSGPDVNKSSHCHAEYDS